MTTNVPSSSFTDRGFIAPPESAVLLGILRDINTAFGGNLNLALETPQGQLGSSIAAIVGDKNTQFMLLTNQVDPAFSSGRMQDAIGRIYFISRIPDQSTIVAADCNGAAGTVIPTGTYALAEDGHLYVCLQGGIIPDGGLLSLNWACTTPGPVACPAGSLSQPYRTIPGWDSISNPRDGTLGRLVENRAQFEQRRSESVAVNSVGPITAVRGAVRAVDGVTDCFVYDNVKKVPVTFGGITINANSICVVVVGGSNDEVAKAIWTKKAPGCGYNTGNTTVTVYDEDPEYTAPFPSYDVAFIRPPATPVYLAVNLAANVFVPNDAVSLVQQAIIVAFGGGDNGPRATIGSTIFASRFYTAVAALGSWVQIRSIKIGGAASPNADSLTMNINQMPTVSEASIAVVVS